MAEAAEHDQAQQSNTDAQKEMPALDAVHQAGAGQTAEDGLEVKGLGEDAAQHLGQQAEVHHNDDQRDQHVQAAHEGDQGGGDLHDALAAAHDAVAHQQGQDGADDPGGGFRVIEAVSGEGGLEIVGGQHIEAAGVGQDQGESEDDGQGTAVKGGLNVVGGAAVALTRLRVPALVDLGQGGLHKGGGAADDGDRPSLVGRESERQSAHVGREDTDLRRSADKHQFGVRNQRREVGHGAYAEEDQRRIDAVTDAEIEVVEHRAFLVDADSVAGHHRDIADDDTETDRHQQHGLELVFDGEVEEEAPHGDHDEVLVAALLQEELRKSRLVHELGCAFAEERR